MSVSENTVINALIAVSSRSPCKLLGGIAKNHIEILRIACHPLSRNAYIHIHICIYICIHTYIHIYIYAYYIYKYIYMYMRIYMYMFRYVYKYICFYKSPHTYIYIHILVLLLLLNVNGNISVVCRLMMTVHGFI